MLGLGKKETIGFISKMYYPLVIRRTGEDEYLVVDPVSLFYVDLTLTELPKVEDLLSEMNSITSADEFMDFLKRHLYDFDKLVTKKTERVIGVLPAGWAQYMKDIVGSMVEEEEKPTLLTGKLTEIDIEDIISKLVEYKKVYNKHVEVLDRFLKELEEKTIIFNDNILQEEKKIALSYLDRIKAEMEQFKVIKEQLESEKKQKLDEVEAEFSKKKEELIAKLSQLKNREKEAEKTLRDARELNDATLMSIAQNELDSIRKQINIFNEKLKNLETEKLSKKKSIEEEYNRKIEIERRKIVKSQAERDKLVNEKEKVRKSMLSYSDYLKNKTSQIVEECKKSLSQIDSLFVKHIPLTVEEELVKIYIPFYTINYVAGRESRMLFVFPAKVGKPGTFADLYGKQVPVEGLNPLCDGLQRQMTAAVQAGHEVSAQIRQIGMTSNLLADKTLLPILNEGLRMLMSSRWLEQREVTEIYNAFVQYFQAPPPPPPPGA